MFIWKISLNIPHLRTLVVPLTIRTLGQVEHIRLPINWSLHAL